MKSSVVIIELTLAAYVLYLVVSTGIRRLFKVSGQSAGSELCVYLERVSGVCCLGVLPLFLLGSQITGSPQEWGMVPRQPAIIGISLIVAVLLFLPAARKRSANPGNLTRYPMIRTPRWNQRILILSSLTWLLYLAAYEFLFRGVLLFGCWREFGAVQAVLINAALYSLAHLPKGRFETLGAIPLGMVFCLLTLLTGSFWLAFGIHSFMALSNEWYSARNCGFLEKSHV